ncbi:MAG: BrnT family toxin [Magnetococcales bacterium]|nr:BrnT family toxin [Magnetococcales bacterium]
MKITYDTTKDASNKEKHGLSLQDAAYLDWRSVMVMPDDRRDYGELREVGYGLIGDRLHCVVFVMRENELRVISFRKANRREIIRYVSRLQNSIADS